MTDLILVLFLSMIQLLCNNDDMKFVNKGDNSHLEEGAEFQFDQGLETTNSKPR